MKKRTVWVAAFMALAMQGMAQDVLPQDVAGDKMYAQVCREYLLKSENSLTLLQAYLERYPDSRHANRVEAMIASLYFDQKKYGEAIASYRSCKMESLPEKERDESICKLGMAYLKEKNLKEATIWFNLLKSLSKKHQADAVYHLSYIDYVENRYPSALEGFLSLKQDEHYRALVPYFIADIYLNQQNYKLADAIATAYLKQYRGQTYETEMYRVKGEVRYGLQDYQEAVTALQAYESATATPQRKALYELGMSYYQTGVYSKAASTLNRTTTVDDALSQHAYLHAGLAYLQLKERNQARLSFEQASVSDADRSVKEQALYNYALCIHETSYSAFAESVTVFERFLNEFPQSAYTEKVNDYLVEVYMNTRSYDAALKSIAKIQHPSARILEAKQRILFRLGTQSFANAGFNQALDYLNQSLALGSYNKQNRADAYYWRGESNYRLEDYAAAASDLRNFLSLSNDASKEEYKLAQYNLGYSEFKQKHYGAAAQWFGQFVEGRVPGNKQVLADAYNRLGDCSFYSRRFDQARQCYTKSVQVDPSFGDYSLFQEGFVKGLQRDYNGKIVTLNKLFTDYPESSYLDDALYEQGRAYILLEDNKNAIARYQLLVSKFPESPMARRAANEIGLLYYQGDHFNEAIAAYKQVIQKYPGSEEARLAQRDLKSIYIDLNKVDDYVTFVSTIPGGANFDVNERDSLTFVAAERLYMRNELTEARASFLRYLQTFPEGAFSVNAHYYIGLVDYNQQQYESAVAHLDHVLNYPNNKFSEKALQMRADVAYKSKDYSKSLELYKLWTDKATTAENRQLAETGMLRSAYMTGSAEETTLAANKVLAGTKLNPELENEARYYRSRALVQANQLALAVDDWKVLSKDTRNIYGAEAKYQLAQYQFNSGLTAEAEKEVLNFIETSTPHAYWLARSFVLLADIYMKMDREQDARNYLLSLKQNYQAEDDIAGMIESRLKMLNKENKQ